MTEELWTIDELGARVAQALENGYEGQSSGRVRQVPDQRTIRYYTTLGLIDRPAEMRGRTALYGRRHLLQLVAIKRLQARGLSLAEVQTSLAGATARRLRDLARLPAVPEASEESARPEPVARSRRAEAFWGALPADAAGAESDPGARREPDDDALDPVDADDLAAADAEASEAAAPAQEASAPAGASSWSAAPAEPAARAVAREPEEAPRGAGRVLTALPLDARVTLLLPAGRAIEADDVRAIEEAARPLLRLLRTRALIERSDEER